MGARHEFQPDYGSDGRARGHHCEGHYAAGRDVPGGEECGADYWRSEAVCGGAGSAGHDQEGYHGRGEFVYVKVGHLGVGLVMNVLPRLRGQIIMECMSDNFTGVGQEG